MIGARFTVESTQFLHVLGLLIDEGLVPDVDFMPVGGSELVVDFDAWERVGAGEQKEIARFVQPGGDVVVVSPAGNVDEDGSAVAGAESSRPTRSNRSTTKGE